MATACQRPSRRTNTRVYRIFPTKKQETRLYIVPKRGVIEREGGKRVVVIVDGKVQTKPVTVVREVGADVYISAGLNGSESIIVSESDKLKVGDRVESKK